MYSSFSAYSITVPSDIRTNKCNFNAVTQAKNHVSSDILDRIKNMVISIDTIYNDCQSERDQNLFQQECFNIAIEKMQIKEELLDIRLQEAVDSLKTRINYKFKINECLILINYLNLILCRGEAVYTCIVLGVI